MSVKVRIADSKPARQSIAAHIRWMILRDMPEVFAIENHSFQFPWRETDFIRCLRQRHCIGMVAEQDKVVAGYMIYELQKARLHLLSMAVHKDYRLKGVGSAMVQKLIGKLSETRRSRIMLEIRETNLDAQLFFRRMGFRAVSVIRDFYQDTPEDTFLFSYRYAR